MTTVALALLFSTLTQTQSLPEGLLSALCYVESRHKPKAVNGVDGRLVNGIRAPEASIGLCQLKVKTAKQFDSAITKRKLLIPQYNAYIAAQYLKWQLKRYGGDVPCAIAAYNAGSCRLNNQGKIKNRHYVEKVIRVWENETRAEQ